jgi:nicotinate-nucleotide adenylyltransferase
MKTLKEICKAIQKQFESSFGQTPLRQRNEDILREAIELSRFTSIANLKEEHGDLLCSLLMSCQENGWDPEECIEATLAKIKCREAQYKAYGRKLNVAVLGGAFDPVHEGHIAVAKFVLDFSSMFDQAWLMPCYKHLYGKKMADAKHRLEMCHIAAEGDRRIIVSDYEIKHKLGGETYHLTKKLLEEDFAKHQYDFSFVIGMDNANTFDKWQNFEDLERMVRFVVIPRKGYENSHSGRAWYMKVPHMFLVPEKELPEISSSAIRKAFENYDSAGICLGSVYKKEGARSFLKKYLNSRVLKYAINKRLYRKCL